MRILIVFLFTSAVCLAQNPHCPKGKVYMGGLESSDLIIEGGCYTPAESKKLQLEFAKDLCMETQMGEFIGDEWMYSDDHTFVNGHCTSTQTYKHRIYGKWIRVTEEQYYRGTCLHVEEGVADGLMKVKYPKPEWTECKP